MRSVRRFARIAFALFGPRTNRIASAMFDFPDPFGPVTAVNPVRNGTRTLFANDLKFSISISFRNKASPRWKAWTERSECPSHPGPSDCPTFVGRRAEYRETLLISLARNTGHRVDKRAFRGREAIVLWPGFRSPGPGETMRVVLGVVLVGVLLLSGLPWHSSPSDSPVRPNLDGGRPSPTAGTFVGWRDDFNDRLKVGSYSNLALSAGVVRLPSPDPNNLTRQGLVLGRGAPADFDSAELGGPTVVLDQGTYKMWYFGDNGGGTSIGYATSTNRVAWTKQGVALAPSLPQDSLYAAYPEVLKVGGGFVMWYSGFDGSNYRILHATRADGGTWTKQAAVVYVGQPVSMDDWCGWAPAALVP